MKYRVLGPRVLLKVKKVKKDQTFEGLSILMPETMAAMEDINQCVGVVIELGEKAFKRTDAFCNGESPIKIGDKVHFFQYGAMRIGNPNEDEDQLWAVMDKDIWLVDEEV